MILHRIAARILGTTEAAQRHEIGRLRRLVARLEGGVQDAERAMLLCCLVDLAGLLRVNVDLNKPEAEWKRILEAVEARTRPWRWPSAPPRHVRVSVWLHQNGRLALLPGKPGTSPCDQEGGHGQPCGCGWTRQMSGYLTEDRVVTSDDPHDDEMIFNTMPREPWVGSDV